MAGERGEWKVFRPTDPNAEIVARRFGRDHERKCNSPVVLTCAMWECQVANECRLRPLSAKEEGRNE